MSLPSWVKGLSTTHVTQLAQPIWGNSKEQGVWLTQRNMKAPLVNRLIWPKLAVLSQLKPMKPSPAKSGNPMHKSWGIILCGSINSLHSGFLLFLLLFGRFFVFLVEKSHGMGRSTLAYSHWWYQRNPSNADREVHWRPYSRALLLDNERVTPTTLNVLTIGISGNMISDVQNGALG